MSKKVSQIAYIFFWLWIWIPWLDTAQSAEMGPLHVQHRYPLYLIFLTPEPDSPRLIEKGRFVTSLSADYASTRTAPDFTIHGAIRYKFGS